jgi:tetratricopeptide (TPR) repeat protein
VLQRVARGHLTQSDAPPLTDLEALEILQSFSAPPKLLANFASVRFLNTVAQHHPALFTAIALFLEAHGWQWRDQQFEDLLLGRFAQGVNDETIRRLLATVTDGPSRNLLYRLNLVIGAFDIETVRVLAEVEPSVHEPRERLTTLTGLWVQRDTEDQLRVSPLIHTLGSDDLTNEVKRGCYSAMAEQLLKKRTLTPNEFEKVITYLAAAREHERAVLLLTWGLSQLEQALKTGKMDTSLAKKLGLHSIFWEVPLPQSVSLQTRLLLRSQQLQIAEVLSRDISFVLADLSRLIDEAGEAEAMGLVAVAISAAPILARVDFDVSCRCLTKAVHALPQITLPEGSLKELLPGLTPGSLLWINLFGVRTKAHVHCWCDMLSNVPMEVRQQALSDQLADMGASVLVDRLWLAEADRPTAERNWERVIADIDEIAAKFEAMAAEFLVATAVRAKILVLCEHLHQPDRAIALAEAALTHLSDDLRVRFMICDAIGQQLSYVDNKETEAAVWLQRADSVCERIPQRLQWERAITLLALARLADKRGEADTTAALLARAVELVHSLPHRSEAEMAKMLGELAIAEWKQGNYRGAFEALDDAAPRLLNTRTEVAEWKALFTIFGHTAGYMASCASVGHPPTLEDGNPYVLPPVGNFHNMKEAGLASVYRPERDIALPCIMVQCARAVERDDRVSYWANQAIEVGRQSPAAGSVVATITFSILPHLVVSGRLPEFFDSVREAVFTTVATQGFYQRGDRDVLFEELDIEVLLGGRGSDDWDRAEQLVLNYTLALLAIYLGTLTVRAREHTGSAEQLLQYTQHAISLCHEAAAISMRADDWSEAARLIEECYENNPVLERVVQHANTYTEDRRALKILGYIGATLQSAVVLTEACRAQMAVLPYCLGYPLWDESTYRLLLLPFVEAFWGWAIEHRRVCFSPPAVVEHEFQEAVNCPIHLRAKRIMHVVANGLGVRYAGVVNDGFRQWEALEGNSRRQEA